MKLKLLQKLAFSSLLFLLSAGQLLAYDFQPDTEQVLEELKNNGENIAQIKLAVFFIESQPALKYAIDLSATKAEFIETMSQKLLLADPFITSDYQQSKKIDYDFFKNRDQKIKSIYSDLQNSHILTVEFQAINNQQLTTKYELFDKNGDSQFKFSRSQGLTPKNTVTKNPVSNAFAPLAGLNLFRQSVRNGEPWGYYHPRAFLGRNDNSFYLNTTLWAKSFSEPDITIRTLRLDYRYRITELGIVANGNEGGSPHSAYIHGKVSVLNEESVGYPVFLSLGIRQRLYWNSKNLDFTNKNLNDAESEKSKDKFTLYLSADYRIDQIGVVGGFYIDNLNKGADISIAAPLKTVLALDLWFPGNSGSYTAKDNKLSYSEVDWALSIKHLTTEYFTFQVNYQRRPNTLGLSFSFDI